MGLEYNLPTHTPVMKDTKEDQEENIKDEEVVFSKEDQVKMQQISDSITNLINETRKMDDEYLSGDHSVTEHADYSYQRRKNNEEESNLIEELSKLKTKKEYIENFDEKEIEILNEIEEQINIIKEGKKTSIEESRIERFNMFLEICEKKKSKYFKEIKTKIDYLINLGKSKQ